MRTDRRAFGLRLKQAREHRGVTLKAIAESTKIRESWLVALERGDVSQWPQGMIFRRAYVRDYAEAVALPPETVVTDFLRLFPEEEAPADLPLQTAEYQEAVGGATVRNDATAGTSPAVIRPQSRGRTLAFDAGAVLVVAGVTAGLTGTALWPALGVVGVGYVFAGTALCGQSFGAWLLTRSDPFIQRQSRQPAAVGATRRELLLIAERNAERKQRGAEVHRLEVRPPIEEPVRPARRASA